MNIREWTKEDLFVKVKELEAECDSLRFERDSARYQRDEYRSKLEGAELDRRVFPLPPGEVTR